MCSTGYSGRRLPGEAHDARPPDAGGEDDVVGRGSCPGVVCTPRTRPPPVSSPVTSQSPNACSAPVAIAPRPSASAARSALPIPSSGTNRPPRMRSGSTSGSCSATSAGVQELGCQAEGQSAPVAAVELLPALLRRRDLDAADGVEARQPVSSRRSTARPIAGRAGSSCGDGLIWNMSPGACEVEPPVSHSGPCSTRTTSDQPRRVEVVCQTGARDAGPDDHHACRPGSGGAWSLDPSHRA